MLLANRHEIYRRGIDLVFKKQAPHIQIIWEASSFEEVLMLLTKFQSDLLLTGDHMPDGNIFSFLPLLKEQYPGLKIIINSMHDEHAYFFKLMEWAQGWVAVTAPAPEYIKVVEHVYSGGYYLYIPGYDK